MANNYILSNEIEFDAKPEAVPYNYRISYKISQLLLIISLCCRGGCSLIKLNMISIAMCTQKEKKQLLDFSNDKLVEIPIIRFDPAVNRAMLFAMSDGLVAQQKDGKFKLSVKGKDFVDLIKADDELMRTEKMFLSELSIKLTEEKIKNIMVLWRYTHAEN
ncbi:MAG: hypothetical protein EOM05_02570 [Clostridia bacterium]|nr:hypothetical protein [Clostridia bacterium]